MARVGLPVPRILVEPGRSIVATAGVTAYTVGTIKQLPGIRTFVSVDGGMSDNIRPMLYQAKYEAVLANRMDDPADAAGHRRRQALREQRRAGARRAARPCRGWATSW